MESEPMLTPREKSPLSGKFSSEDPTHQAGQWAQHTTNQLFLPPSGPLRTKVLSLFNYGTKERQQVCKFYNWWHTATLNAQVITEKQHIPHMTRHCEEGSGLPCLGHWHQHHSPTGILPPPHCYSPLKHDRLHSEQGYTFQHTEVNSHDSKTVKLHWEPCLYMPRIWKRGFLIVWDPVSVLTASKFKLSGFKSSTHKRQTQIN